MKFRSYVWNRRPTSLERVKAGNKVSNFECKLLSWLKLSFHPEPKADLTKNLFRSASKKLVRLCNQQVDFVSIFRELSEKCWHQTCLLDKYIKGAQIWTKYNTKAEAYLYVWGVGRVDRDALSDENPNIGCEVVDLRQIRSTGLKQRISCFRTGMAMELSFLTPHTQTPHTPTGQQPTPTQPFMSTQKHYQ